MSSDDHNKNGRDAPWRHVGIGQISDFLCPHCNTKQPHMGMRVWRKTPKLMHCAKCEASKANQRMAA